MKENTNRAIAYNSVILYFRMALTTVCALLTTRFALQALGVVDFGLYAVLGGIISFISILNTIMLSTSNRFMAVVIGKGNKELANKQFNVNLSIHVAVAIFALLLICPIGEWYIPRYVNYDGPLENAMMVYYISVLGSITSFVGVPYNGLMMAKERFIIPSVLDVLLHIVKLIVAWILVYHFVHKLFIYTITMSLFTGFSTVVYILYCRKKYHNIVRIKMVKERSMYKEIFIFSAWVSIGAVAQIGKVQGAALIVNAFFNTAINSAMGVASSINAYITVFGQNVTQPMAPQITKSYASGNYQRTNELLIMSTKYSYLLMLLIASFFLVSPEWLLQLWLNEVPPFTSVFLILFIVDNLVQTLNSGIGNIVFASGKIVLYQIVVSTLNVLSLVLGYFVLSCGVEAYYLLAAYIILSIVRFFLLQIILHITLRYDNRILWRNSYIPSILVTVLFVPILLIPIDIIPLLKIMLAFVYLLLLEWFLGLNKTERAQLKSFIANRLNK